MKFNTLVKQERREAFRYFTTLANRHQIVEIKKVNPKRTLNQNSYLHLIISAFGAHFGYTADEAKQIYKEINKEIYRYTKIHRGKAMHFIRSSADLDKEEMAKSIDRFMEASKEAGYALPLATDQEWLRQIENEIERSKYYL